MAKKTAREKHNRLIKIIAGILIAICIIFIVLLLQAADQRSFLVVFVLPCIIAIAIIIFTARDMMK
ncbi:MAG: hypothetical protein K6G64_01130 [Eubacterium sp.]|nr:hypothetical protein [Eubacterium sp.]